MICVILSFRIFRTLSDGQCPSQAVRAGELKFWENFQPPPCFTCHVSHVMCPVSRVRCQVSHFYLFLQSGGASWWRVCYQRGLPRLVCVSWMLAVQLNNNHKPYYKIIKLSKVCLPKTISSAAECTKVVMKYPTVWCHKLLSYIHYKNPHMGDHSIFQSFQVI